ncbi:MAG: ABC transporter permease subunit [Syntrophaceticus schinkii]
MSINVVRKVMRDQRRSLFWWSIGIAALALYTMLFYPSIAGSPELDQMMRELPPALKAMFGEMSLTSPEGYINTELFSFMMPLLFLIFTILQGGAAVAGEEEQGTLDLVLSTPITRRRFVLEKFVAMLVSTLFLAVILWVSTVAGIAIADFEVNLSRLAEAIFSVFLLAMAFGTLAWPQDVPPAGALSTGVSSALAVIAYFLNSMAPLAESVEPFQKLSLFYYYYEADPLRHGLDLGHVGVLLAVTVVLLLIGVMTVGKRDLQV